MITAIAPYKSISSPGCLTLLITVVTSSVGHVYHMNRGALLDTINENRFTSASTGKGFTWFSFKQINLFTAYFDHQLRKKAYFLFYVSSRRRTVRHQNSWKSAKFHSRNIGTKMPAGGYFNISFLAYIQSNRPTEYDACLGILQWNIQSEPTPNLTLPETHIRSI